MYHYVDLFNSIMKRKGHELVPFVWFMQQMPVASERAAWLVY